MNYGKKSVSKKRNSLISRTAMMGKRAHVSLIRVLFVILITICVVIGCTGIGAFRGIIDNAPDVNDIDIMPLGYATFLYDDQGNQIRKLAAPDSNRLPVTLDQIPVDLQHAVVAIEDERFYEHNGIDVKGILRAGMKALTTGDFSEGASTITQQLARGIFLTKEVSAERTNAQKYERKFKEIFISWELEKKYTKQQILEYYLNTIFFSNKSEIFSDFKNKIFQITNDGFLQIMFRHWFGNIKKVKDIIVKKNISCCLFSCFKCQRLWILRQHISFIITAVYLPFQFSL